MRPVFGMRDADKPILTVLSESGLALRPTSMKYNLETRYDFEVSEPTIYRRLKTMEYAGLIEKEDEDRGYYSITDLGDRLLDQGLSDEEVSEVSQLLQEGPD